jgi:hypothetical protein
VGHPAWEKSAVPAGFDGGFFAVLWIRSSTLRNPFARRFFWRQIWRGLIALGVRPKVSLGVAPEMRWRLVRVVFLVLIDFLEGWPSCESFELQFCWG